MRHLIALLLVASLAQAETLGESVRGYLAAAETAKTGPWEVTGALGITYTDGVTDTTSISAGVDALREWPEWKLTIRWLSTFTKASGVTQANEHILITRGDYKLSDRASIFGSLLLEYDEIEGVEPRIQFILGYDRKLVTKETFELLGNLGGGVLYEKYPVGGSTTDAIAQAGLDWTWKITKQLTYTQVLRFLPNISESGEYRVISESVFTTPISEMLDLRLTILDQYNSDPLPGVEKNDLKVVLAIAIRFTKPKKKA